MWALPLNGVNYSFYYSKFYQFLPVQLRFSSWLLLYAGSVIFSNLAFPLIKVIVKFPFPSCFSAPKSLHQHVWYVLSSQKQAPYSRQPKLWNTVPTYLCSLPLPIPTVSLQAPPKPSAYLLQLALFLLSVVLRSCQLACSSVFLRKLNTFAVPTT